MAPNALDVRDAGLLQVIPDARGVERNAIALGDRQKRRIAEQDRIIAIENPLDADDTFIAAMSVISRPFAEGPFRVRLFFGRGHFAFDDNFSCCGDRQSGEWRSDHFERRAAQRAGIFIFTHTGFGGGRRSQPGSGLATEHDGDGTGASRVPISARDLFAVLVLDDPERNAILGNDAGAVGADVDPAAIRIFDNHHVAGADVAPAVVLVPFGRGKNIQVDAITFENILAYRAR